MLKAGGVGSVSIGVVWNAMLVVVETPVIVKTCVVNGHVGHSRSIVDRVVTSAYACEVLKADGVVSAARGEV